MSRWDSVFIKSNTDASKIFKSQTYRPGALIPVFPAISLLADKRHQFFLEQLKEHSGLTSEQYEIVYKRLIDQFVEFVQVLPAQNDGPLCGLMNEGLVRGINGLHQLLSDHRDSSPLERYAIFSAALLKDVANVVVNQRIFITDKEGNFVLQWQPFDGSLESIEEAEYYKIMPLSSTYHRIAHSITPLLARQLLPQEGFDWIASDPHIFVDWLDALRDEEGEGTARITHTLQLYKTKVGEGLIDSLPAVHVPQEDSPATQYADSFFVWLQKGIDSGEIQVNTPTAGVHVTQEGVFLERPGAFKQYVDLHVDIPVNMFSVYQQFGNLFGLTKLSGIDYRFEQLFSEYPELSQEKHKTGFSSPLASKGNSVREGVMIADPNLVFLQSEIPQPTPFLKPLPTVRPQQNLPKIIFPTKNPENKLK